MAGLRRLGDVPTCPVLLMAGDLPVADAAALLHRAHCEVRSSCTAAGGRQAARQGRSLLQTH